MIGMCNRRNVSLRYFGQCSCSRMVTWPGAHARASLGSNSDSASLSSVNLYAARNISALVSSSGSGDDDSPCLIDCGEDEISHIKSLEHCLTHGKQK